MSLGLLEEEFMRSRVLAALALASTLLVGCSSGTDDTSKDDGAVSNTAYVETDDGEIKATVTKKDGKVTAVKSMKPLLMVIPKKSLEVTMA